MMETAILKVDGMTCNGCVRSVTNVLQDLPGVDSVEVTLESARASVTFDPKEIDLARLREAIADAGFETS